MSSELRPFTAVKFCERPWLRISSPSGRVLGLPRADAGVADDHLERRHLADHDPRTRQPRLDLHRPGRRREPEQDQARSQA
jgi:hypothetical protein